MLWSRFVGLLWFQFHENINKLATRVQFPYSYTRWDKNLLLWNSEIVSSTRRAFSSVFTIRLRPPPSRFRTKERVSPNFRTNFDRECLKCARQGMYASICAFAIHFQNFKNCITINILYSAVYNAIFTNNAVKINSHRYHTPRVSTSELTNNPTKKKNIKSFVAKTSDGSFHG